MVKMMVLEDLRLEMSWRNISIISGISQYGYYYKHVKRRIQRLDPSTMGGSGVLHWRGQHTDTGEYGQCSETRVQR